MDSPRSSRMTPAAWAIALALAPVIGPSIVPAQSHAAGLTPDRIRAATQAIDGAAIRGNAKSSRDWPTIGADYAETRYSQLAEITADNAKDLGLVWTYNRESTRGVEATPLVVDGIMYVTASWSVV